MKSYAFELVIEKEPDDEGYFAYSPTLKGCFSNGRSIEDTKKKVREAIHLHRESLLDHDQPVPQKE